MTMQLLVVVLVLTLLLATVNALATPSSSITVVTGASGFVGRHVVYSLLSRHRRSTPSSTSITDDVSTVIHDSGSEVIVCLVRPNRVSYEESYWNAHLQEMDLTDDAQVCVKVLPYDMLDDGASLYDALQSGHQHHRTTCQSKSCSICVHHIASVFGPTSDPIQTAKDNVQSAEYVVRAMHQFQQQHCADIDADNTPMRLVLTSSMAAVRATNQTPLNERYYTYRDWNTMSKLDDKNWGSCYQWSKAESERKALELVEKYNNGGSGLDMVALCPSFVFGPPPPFPSSFNVGDASNGSSSSYSLELVKQWLYGKSEVQSRLCADVRDVAQAHVAAGTMDISSTGDDTSYSKRYIVSTEERLSSELVAEALRRAIQNVQSTNDASKDVDMSNIICDTKFDGGAIKIGEREVEATERLQSDLGVVCRSVEDTMQNMAEALLQEGF